MHPPVKPITWIGLGKMGLPITALMVRGGYAVQGCDRSLDRRNQAAANGVHVSTLEGFAPSEPSIVFTSLPDDRVLLSLLSSSHGVLNKVPAGSIVVETSTVSPDASAELATQINKLGSSYVRAPISGNAAIADTGNLTCFVSGLRSDFDEVRPILRTFTRAQTFVGHAEQARYAKLAVNLMVAVSAGMLAEALALARKGGIEWQNILDALVESAIASPLVKYKASSLSRRDFTPAFSCGQIAKDLDLILDAGRASGLPLELAAHMRRTYGTLISQGEADTDFTSTVRLLERLVGLDEPRIGSTASAVPRFADPNY